ncbi:hypothetical protein pCPXV0202 [Cowpox virus]|uniref:Uncharacterized protein n=1 Tax=Cowpox virus TaxID=10243 RepID=A0A212PWK5_COWPX|nr:hypothetical protein pCPXV0202 [Cowpox virus]SNB50242.1 hypothetical protein pCPXV0202 [Cowpox virus]SNB51397.1 hypothetical protein pCPXV0202 [Cowpox virus]SNB53298.1 hypothetical protein pCPXV0202 [Cowpox virus]SNB56463.1 hypothetical protein pCPXV0202 [Cowpox virus]
MIIFWYNSTRHGFCDYEFNPRYISEIFNKQQGFVKDIKLIVYDRNRPPITLKIKNILILYHQIKF